MKLIIVINTRNDAVRTNADVKKLATRTVQRYFENKKECDKFPGEEFLGAQDDNGNTAAAFTVTDSYLEASISAFSTTMKKLFQKVQ